ncbi:SpaA isopeptide-forming pilin-related protein [Lactobacillus sp.]|uniref:SpaA isopeptide-forming pilin-related protein n=1 Tax=Lactobacillus sp. TaxID=1591 RepID=UPI003EFAB8A2
MMQILKKSKTIMAALLLIFQLLVPLTQVKAADSQVTDQLTFYQEDKQLSGKDVKDQLKVKAGETTVLTLKRKEKDQASDVKIALPVLFAFEKEDTVKANKEVLDKGEDDLKKLDPASLVELKKEDETSYLLLHFNVGQTEIKFALKGVKEANGQLVATYKDSDQDYTSYPVSAVVEIAEEKAVKSEDTSSSSTAESASGDAVQSTETSKASEAKQSSTVNKSEASEGSSASPASSKKEDSTKEETKETSEEKSSTKKNTVEASKSVAVSPKLPFTARMLRSQLAAANEAVTSDANVDLVISPDSEQVKSGQTALYTVNFKVSGSRYDEASRWPTTLTFSLKDTASDHLHISTSLLPSINGVTPTVADGKVTYTFKDKDALQAGQAYSFKMSVRTDNGYLANGTKAVLQGQFKDATGFEKEASGSTEVTASTPLVVTKTFLGAKNAQPNTAPGKKDVLAWRVSFSLDAQDGLNFLDPNQKLKIVDSMQDGEFYGIDDDTLTKVGTYFSKTLRSATFEMDTPSIEEQKSNLDSGMPLVSHSFIIYTSPTYTWSNNERVVNKIDIDGQSLSGNAVTAHAEATGVIGEVVPGYIEDGGDLYLPTFMGPKDGEGNYGGNQVLTTVYDTASLTYKSLIVSSTEGNATTYKNDRTRISQYDFNNKILPQLVKTGLQKSVVHYDLSEHLILKHIYLETPRLRLYQPSKAGQPSSLPYPTNSVPGHLVTMQVKNIKTGATRTVSKFTTILGKYIPVSYFGLTDDDRVLSMDVSIQHEDASEVISGKTNGEVLFHAGVEKGFTGRIKVGTKYWVVAKDGTKYSHEAKTNAYNSSTGSYYSLTGPRELQVIALGTTMPVGRIDVAFQKHAAAGNGTIDKNSSNRVVANFYNVTSSQADMKSKVAFVILLPKNVSLASNPDYKLYLVNDKTGEEKQISLSNGNEAYDYGYSHYVKGGAVNVTGRQGIKFLLGDGTNLKPGYHLRGEANVDIGDVSDSVTINAYGGSYTGQLTAPSGYEIIKDKQENEVKNGEIYLQVQSLMGSDSNYKQVVTNSNSYRLSTYDEVKIHKFVKGDEDDDYGQMAHTTPGGSVKYKLQITAGQQIDQLTLMDVLPNVGDLGITDNVSRGSQFEMKLTGPISLDGLNGATIKYSTAKNPSRADLNDSITWPSGATKLTDQNAEKPTWLTADQVTDWSKIHSFLITSGSSSVKTGQTATLEFTMQAPKRNELTTSQLEQLFDQSIAEKQRAAWNSFAITANKLLPVEPERVGVVMKDAGVRILKKATLTGENLTGVKFKLADSEANAAAGRFLRIKDGKVLAPGESGYSSASDYEANSKDGVVQFYGLNDSQTYYAVETEALSGYRIDSTPHAVTASYNPLSKQITVYNRRDIVLPKTGSSWMALFLIVGFAGIAAGFYFSRKGKEDK